MTHQSVQNPVDLGMIGFYQLKNGRPPKFPQQFTKALATHSTMMTVYNMEGKAYGRNMLTTIDAMTDERKWEGKYSTD